MYVKTRTHSTNRHICMHLHTKTTAHHIQECLLKGKLPRCIMDLSMGTPGYCPRFMRMPGRKGQPYRTTFQSLRPSVQVGNYLKTLSHNIHSAQHSMLCPILRSVTGVLNSDQSTSERPSPNFQHLTSGPSASLKKGLADIKEGN